jgi:hypothetical protein
MLSGLDVAHQQAVVQKANRLREERVMAEVMRHQATFSERRHMRLLLAFATLAMALGSLAKTRR